MDEREFLADRFEEHRPRLRAVAYRMLGSLSEADDAVQEAWLRLSRTDASEVENLAGWLTTVVARISLNMLRSRNVRREEPISVRMPEPIVDRADGIDPEHAALLADSVGLALLVVLETLSPAERLAFVLHDIFAVPFDEIAPIVDRSPEATRQLASRARRRVQGENTVPDADLEYSARGRRRVSRGRARRRLRGDCSRCWTRTSCCARTSVPCLRAAGERFAGRAAVAASGARATHSSVWSCAGARQRRSRSSLDPRRRDVLGRGHHGQGRKDRRDRHPRRPGAASSARPDRPRHLRPCPAGAVYSPRFIAPSSRRRS